jgi:hypothetical protein
MSQQQWANTQPQQMKQLEPQRMAQPYNYPTEQPAANLMDLIDRILDKGLVVDLYIKINLVGIELLEIQARLVVAGIEAYLRYAREMQQMGLAAKPQFQPRPQLYPQSVQSQHQQQQQQPQRRQQQQQGRNIPVNAPQMRRQMQRPNQNMQKYIQR